VQKILEAFSGDFFLDETAVRAAYQPPYQFNAIDQRSTFKVDFWLSRQIPFEREMFARRMKKTLFGESAWIGTAEDILLHKLYWNQITPSTRQLGDAAGIAIVQENKLDFELFEAWGERTRRCSSTGTGAEWKD